MRAALTEIGVGRPGLQLSVNFGSRKCGTTSRFYASLQFCRWRFAGQREARRHGVLVRHLQCSTARQTRNRPLIAPGRPAVIPTTPFTAVFMSEEPTLFDTPAPPPPRKTWRQRIKAVFTEPVKLPGWAAVLLVIVEVVPDWKSRFEFWLQMAKGMGGGIAMAATVIASPYFTPTLLAAGLS
jgi:hypothetical protein